jgi:solute:Na+ symporter, SSS family
MAASLTAQQPVGKSIQERFRSPRFRVTGIFLTLPPRFIDLLLSTHTRMEYRLLGLDLAIVVAYLVGTTLLALWFVRQQRDIRTYFVGDRNVSWWLVLTSVVATETSTVTFLSTPGLSFDPTEGDFTFLQLTLGYFLGRVLVAWILLPQYMSGELFSAYQLLRERFDVRVQRLASALFLVTRTIADGLRLYLTGLLVHQFTGFGVEVSIIIMGVTTIFYTYLGGMQAVIWTDLIQFVVYLLGAIVAGGFILWLLPDGFTSVMQAGSGANKFRMIDLSLDLSKNYTLWAGVLGGAVFSMASHGADHIMVQRYLCARSLTEARVALILSGAVVMAQFFLFLLIGVGLYALTQEQVLIVPSGTRNDEVFGLFIMTQMPTGLIGIIVAAVLAAAMSTLSSSLNSSAGALVADFYRPLRPNRDEAHYLFMSRLMTVAWGVAQTTVALVSLWIGSQRSVISQVLTVAGLTTGLMLGLFILGSMRRPVSSNAALAGFGFGAAAVIGVWLPSTFGPAILGWPWYAPVGMIATVSVAWLVDRLVMRNGPSSDRGTEPRVG